MNAMADFDGPAGRALPPRGELPALKRKRPGGVGVLIGAHPHRIL
jgi:hypothetical protein